MLIIARFNYIYIIWPDVREIHYLSLFSQATGYYNVFCWTSRQQHVLRTPPLMESKYIGSIQPSATHLLSVLLWSLSLSVEAHLVINYHWTIHKLISLEHYDVCKMFSMSVCWSLEIHQLGLQQATKQCKLSSCSQKSKIFLAGEIKYCSCLDPAWFKPHRVRTSWPTYTSGHCSLPNPTKNLNRFAQTHVSFR